jgi:hypothetical protein
MKVILQLLQLLQLFLTTQAIDNFTQWETDGSFITTDATVTTAPTVPTDASVPTVKSEPNIAFLSLIIQFCTFWIAIHLRKLKSGKIFGKKIRENLADFAVPITVAIMVGFVKAFPEVKIQKLTLPEGIQLTLPQQRNWFVSPMGIDQEVPIWVIIKTIQT